MKSQSERAAPPGTLTATERRILQELQKDGRMTNVELAARVGLSSTACWNQTQALLRRGVIQTIKAVLDPESVGLGTLALVGVVLDRSTPEAFSAFEQAITGLANVLECYLVAGDVDYFLKVRVANLADFHLFHSTCLIGIPGVRQVRTFFVFSEVKIEVALPL